MSFKITKENNSDIWKHSWTEDTSKDLILSIGYFRMVDTVFQLYTESGGKIRNADLSEIILQDISAGGGEETFSDPLTFVTRLKSLNYPLFV